MIWAALCLGLAGAMAAYAGSRHQRMLPSPLPRRWSVAGWTMGWSMAAASLFATLGPLAAAFALVIAAMLGLSVSAFLGAILARRTRP